MTVPPPPAVPGELIEKAAKALRVALWGPYGKQPPDVAVAEHVLAAVYGDIVEAARRDALTAAVDAVGSLAGRFHTANWNDALGEAGRVLADLIDENALRSPLSATHADQTPVPRIPGTPERSQGHSGPSGQWCGCGRCDADRRSTLPWPERIATRMILCPQCGNKRCPRASWHGNDCTGSNDYGQPGSDYAPAPVRDAEGPQNAAQPLAARPTMRPYWHGSQPGGVA